MALGQSIGVRFAARSSAVVFLLGSMLLGLAHGGHFEDESSPFRKLGGKLAGLVGYAASDIRISGLVHQDAQSVLATIGVQPGGSLIGFDAAQARRLLENVDWVNSAKVSRLFPNQLEISVVEREPFAVWQRDGRYYVIDRSGAAISSLVPGKFTNLLLVTGEGAQAQAASLVEQLVPHPELKARVKAAARAGHRRWDVVLDNGLVISLPEHGLDDALREAERLDRDHGLLSKGVARLDLRIPGKSIVTVAEVKPAASSKDADFKVSGRQ
jgi:cell division protein FtsQ